MSRRYGARELIDIVLDEGSFQSWDRPADISEHAPDYRATLAAAAEHSGVDESVLTGLGRLNGRPVVVVINEFQFLAGSIGRAAAERIVTAVQRATVARLPLLAATASGGTRMQEGTPAFVQMIEITRAIMRHRAAGLPYLAYLRHPTTGGVYASWGSLAHVTVGEPGALIGFLGPKVYEALEGVPFPQGIQTAEHLADCGVIDAVAAPEDLRGFADAALSVLVDTPSAPTLPVRLTAPKAPLPAWESIERTRSHGRIGVRDLLRYGASGTVRLRGTNEGERDDSVLIALTRLDGQPCVVVGQDRERQDQHQQLGPSALRAARRAMRLAEELWLPLVTIIDTPGAELSPSAEARAMAGEIARCLATMASLTVPTISVILGQGCGGGALALLPAHEVIATEHAWLSPLPPEGASVIVHGDTAHAAELAAAQQVRAADLLAHGVVHQVVAELDGESPRDLATAVVAAVARSLAAGRVVPDHALEESRALHTGQAAR
ncbi:carboxyl transferase domain-containing protein [Saccharopolyspora sp. NPDC049426]|uniref:carboxyl transferase domain-containing protein n=1 Tax=Saccharopolyspora sp. NPDC049426 TaxID=3155652 RepID=UPI00342B2FC8